MSKQRIGPVLVEYVPGGVLVSRADGQGEAVLFPLGAWEAFLEAIRRGEYDDWREDL